MVTILPPTESFGAAMGRTLGSAAHSVAKGWADKRQEQAKIKRFQDIINPKQSPEVSNEDIKQKFLSALPEIEQNMGRELTPQDLDQIWQRMQPQQMGQALQGESQQNTPFAKTQAAIAAGLPKEQRDIIQKQEELAETEASKRRLAKEKEERALFSDADKQFWTTIGEQREKLPDLETSLDAQMNAVMAGDVDPWSRGHFADIAKALGAPSALVAELETPGSKQFKTGLKTYLSSTLKGAFRGATTGREIDLAEGLLAQAGATKEGNLASIWLLQSQLMLEKQKVQMAMDLRKQGVSGYEIPDMVYKELMPYRKYLSDQYFQAIQELKKKK